MKKISFLSELLSLFDHVPSILVHRYSVCRADQGIIWRYHAHPVVLFNPFSIAADEENLRITTQLQLAFDEQVPYVRAVS